MPSSTAMEVAEIVRKLDQARAVIAGVHQAFPDPWTYRRHPEEMDRLRADLRRWRQMARDEVPASLPSFRPVSIPPGA